MSSINASGCVKHLLIASGLLLAVIGYALVQNWDAFSLMFDNMTAMGEGAAQAEALRTPADLVDYLAAHPERVSLVAYDLGAEEEGIFYQADTLRPLANVPDVLLLAAYARQAEAGRLDPDRRVALDSIAVYALPGTGESRHQQVRTRWRAAGYVKADGTVALRHVVEGAIRYNDEAAADWLMRAMGDAPLQQAAEALGLAHSEPPLPGSGMQLMWSRHDRAVSLATRIDTLRAMPRSTVAERAYRQMERLRRDTAFRRLERERLARHGAGLSLRQQRTLARQTVPRGSAAEYAKLLERVVTGTFATPGVAELMRAHLERSVANDSVATTIAAVGSKGGAMPGLISFAGYARRADGAPPRIVVLFVEQVPMAVLYHLMQTGLDKGLQLRLLGDDAFFREVRAQLAPLGMAATPHH